MRWVYWELYFTNEETRASSLPKYLAQESLKSVMWSFRFLPIHEISPPHHFRPPQTLPSLASVRLPFSPSCAILPLCSLLHLEATHGSKGVLVHFSGKNVPWLQKKLLLPRLDHFFLNHLGQHWASMFSFLMGVVMKLIGENISGKQTVNCKMLTNISYNY